MSSNQDLDEAEDEFENDDIGLVQGVPQQAEMIMNNNLSNGSSNMPLQ